MEHQSKASVRTIRESSALGRKIVSLSLAAMLQWALILAACPALHELVHPDADDEHHDCAVTAILSGQIEVTSIDPVPIIQPVAILVLLAQIYQAQSSGSFFLSCCILEHAPPSRC